MSTTSHPLLAEALLTIKSGVDGLTNGENEKEEPEVPEEEEELTTALGTLTVADCGASRFVGRVAAEVRKYPFLVGNILMTSSRPSQTLLMVILAFIITNTREVANITMP